MGRKIKPPLHHKVSNILGKANDEHIALTDVRMKDRKAVFTTEGLNKTSASFYLLNKSEIMAN
jgi:hypothetical protein